MLFLLKCLFFLAIVFLAIGIRDGERGKEARGRGGAHPAALTPVEDARASITTFAGRATDGLTEAVRDHCLQHPLDCLHAAERLQAAKAEASGKH